MKIHVATLSAEGLQLEDRIDPGKLPDLAALQQNEDCRFEGPLTVSLRVMPSVGMFQVEGRITGKVILACSRCLAATECPLRNTFRLTFARRIPGDAADSPPEARELQAEELGVVLFEGDQIDFRDIIQEQVILAIPMQPICRQDCRGLCARCGANLNDGPCDCRWDDVDPRLAILKTLKFDS
jgi:uncharacterized protein